jgi:hypothetical protein
VAVALALGGCSSGADEAGRSSTTAAPEAPGFEGDPDSPFCEASRTAAEEPVLDPFASGLDPAEVRVRFEALAQRFRAFADLAPDPLAEDLALLRRRFADLATLLRDADFDFEELAASGEDIAVFDDPDLARVAERLAAYQDQVCTDT